MMETVINSINTGIAGLGWNNVMFGNAGNPNFSGGTPRAFDERPVPFNQKWGFAIQNTVTGNNKTACVRWNTQQSQNTFVVPELPYGTHKIKWFVEDGCGNETVCEYTVHRERLQKTDGCLPQRLECEHHADGYDHAVGNRLPPVHGRQLHPGRPAENRYPQIGYRYGLPGGRTRQPDHERDIYLRRTGYPTGGTLVDRRSRQRRFLRNLRDRTGQHGRLPGIRRAAHR